MSDPRPNRSDSPLLGLRAALILLLAALVGIGAGILTYWGGTHLPGAVLAGVGASGAGTLFFHSIIE